jgi:hypothetical protein
VSLRTQGGATRKNWCPQDLGEVSEGHQSSGLGQVPQGKGWLVLVTKGGAARRDTVLDLGEVPLV